MSGVVQGGWEFVIAAYTITGLGFVGYAISLITRLKEASKHD
jgi:CcmD family protein